MTTAMSNGTIALLNFQKAMAVQSNNAGNVDSLAFKTDKVSFADLFYSDSIGRGTEMKGPIKDFSQGEITATNSGYDFAIMGEGFFSLYNPDRPEQTLYTRAGQFKSDSKNMLVDSEGHIVLGYRPKEEGKGDIITSVHTDNVASAIIKLDDGDITTSINTYISKYEETINIVGSLGEHGKGYKPAGSVIDDVNALLSEYRTALKDYSLQPDQTSSTATTKAVATIKIPDIQLKNDEYTLTITIDGIKYQQNFDESVDNTLEMFTDALSDFTGYKASIDKTKSPFLLTVESLIPGKKVSLTKAQLNETKLSISLEQAEKGVGLERTEKVLDEIKGIFSEVNNKLQESLENNYKNTKTVEDKLYIYSKMTENEKVALYESLGLDKNTVITENSNSEDKAFLSTISDEIAKLEADPTYVSSFETAILDKFISMFDNASIAQNFSTIEKLPAGVRNPFTMDQILLDLNLLGLNSTLAEKIESLESQELNSEQFTAAYPDLESDNGMLYLLDGEAKFLVGYIEPVTFTDKTLLKPEGNSLYTITPPLFPPGEAIPLPIYLKDIATVEGGYLEESNVSISDQLVELLTFQKSYEANSKSITTADEMLKTALALKNR